MTPAHLVTGATGFLGGALTLELLASSDADVVCVVRPREGEDVDARLRRKLADAARAYGREELLSAIDERCRAVAGDVSQPDCGVDPGSLAGRIGTVWHVAASLNFEPDAREETLRHNVEGTAATLSLARALGAEELLYVSTAYVAGRTTGLIREEPVTDPDNANNAYEESKIRAEMLVGAERGLRTRILRPSIVIGHSETHATLSHAGIYGALVDAHQYMQSGIEPMLGGRPLYSPGRDDVHCNLIPVDVVARNAWAVHASGSDERIFHLVNGDAPTLREVTDAICDTAGMLRTVYVDSDEELTDVEKMLAGHPRAQFHHPYMRFDREFALDHTDAAIGPEASRFALPTERLKPFLEAYMQSQGMERPVGAGS